MSPLKNTTNTDPNTLTNIKMFTYFDEQKYFMLCLLKEDEI